MSVRRPATAASRRSRPQLALRVAVLGVLAFALFGDRLLPPLVPAGALGRPVPAPGARQPRATSRVQAPRGAIARPQRRARSSTNRVATVVQLDPRAAARAERDAAATWGQQMTRARARRPKGQRGEPAIPIPRGDARSSCLRFERLGARARHVAADDPASGSSALADARPVREHPRQDRRAGDRCATTCSSAAPSSPASTSSRSTCAATRTRDLGAQLAGHGRRDQPERARARRATAASRQGTIVGKDGHRARLRPLPARRRRRPAHHGRRARAGRRARRRSATRVPGARCARRSTSTSSAPARRVLDRRSRPGRAPPGGVRRARPAQRRGPRDGLEPDLRPGASSSRPITQKRLDAAVRPRRRLAAVQPRDRRPAIRRARRSSRSPRSPRSSQGIITPDTPINDPGCIEIGAAKQTFCNAGKAVNGTISLRARAPGLLGRLLLHAGPRPQRARGPAAAEAGPRASASASRTGHRPARARGRGHDPRPRLARAGRRSAEAALRAHSSTRPRRRLRHLRQAPVDASATTSTSRSARATCRRTPLQMAVAYAAIENGGRVVRPHLGARGRGRRAAASSAAHPGTGARAGSRSTRATARRSSTACTPATIGRRHVGRRLQGLEPERVPGLRQDRHGRARRPRRPVLVRVPSCQHQSRPIVIAVDRRGRRLRRRGGRPGRLPDARRSGSTRRRPASPASRTR